MKILVPKNYTSLLGAIKKRIRLAQYQALKAVNVGLIALYWDIGKMIASRQGRKSWGKSVVEKIATDLQQEFSGISGFSSRNLWRMRDFYLTYHQNEKLPPLVAEIGWTHNLIIMERCKDTLEREFYIRMTCKLGWSKNVLIHQIENQTYEKTLLNQTSFDHSLPQEVKDQAKLAVKDEYTFDFLELGDEHSEKQLESAILARVDPFLKEMGGVFSYVGHQYCLEVGGEEYFIDLLLYHRFLKSLVAIELKIGKFLPEYVGKMQFYLSVLDDKVRIPGENPSIGIILCKNKNKTIVEYALKASNKPIGISKYRMVKELPQAYKGKLPEPKQVVKLLNGLV